MRSANLSNEAVRQADVGFVYEERLTNAQGTLEMDQMSTFRVRAVGATTVTIDGVLAATMMANEILIFCTGSGNRLDNKKTVSIVIAGANAFVQVARNTPRPQPEL